MSGLIRQWWQFIRKGRHRLSIQKLHNINIGDKYKMGNIIVLIRVVNILN